MSQTHKDSVSPEPEPSSKSQTDSPPSSQSESAARVAAFSPARPGARAEAEGQARASAPSRFPTRPPTPADDLDLASGVFHRRQVTKKYGSRPRPARLAPKRARPRTSKPANTDQVDNPVSELGKNNGVADQSSQQVSDPGTVSYHMETDVTVASLRPKLTNRAVRLRRVGATAPSRPARSAVSLRARSTTS